MISEDSSTPEIEIQRRSKDGYWTCDHDHYLYDFFNNCSPHYSFYDVRKTTTANAALSGNGFFKIIRNRQGRPVKLDIRPYKYVQILRKVDGSDEIFYQVDYEYGRQSEILKPYQIFHLKNFSLDGIIGMSPIQRASASISMTVRAMEYADEIYASGGVGRGWIEHPGDAKGAEKNLSDGVQLSQRSKRIPVFDEGMKFNPNVISPKDIDYIETMKLQRREICGIYRVPLYLIQDTEKTTVGNAEELGISYVKYGLTPWLKSWENEMERKLIPAHDRKNTRIKFNMESLLRGDTKSRMELQKALALMQIATKNELRRMNDLPPDPNGDVYVDFQKAAIAQHIGQQEKNPSLDTSTEQNNTSNDTE